jgi:hypothetical protein
MKNFFQERFYPMLLFIAGAVMMAWNHWSILHYHTMFIYVLFVGPPAFWGGMGALIDPRIFYPHYGLIGSTRRLFLTLAVVSLLSIGFLFWLYAVFYGIR